MHRRSHFLIQSICLFFLLGLAACSNTEAEKDVKTTSVNTLSKTALDKMDVYVVAGDYYEMKVGIRGNKLTGVYFDPSAKNMQDCLFFFEGTIGADNPVHVKCYNPTNLKASFNGKFKMVGDAIIAQLNAVPGETCEQEFTDGVGHSVILDMQHNWSQVRMIEQAVDLVDDAESVIATGTRLSKGSIVAVRGKKGRWLWVDVVMEEEVNGWIPEDVLYSLLD